MKLRIRANTIRLRLTRSEVTRAGGGDEVSEQTVFAGASLSYALCAGEGVADASAVRATFDGSTVRVTAPRALLNEWASSERVGFEATHETREGQSLTVLVEKDFTCLTDRPSVEDVDTFPHPSGHC